MNTQSKADLKSKFTCPNCVASLIVKDSEISSETRCPVCQLVFDVPYPVADMAYVTDPGVAAKIYY
jgi:predicted Zn finger-like uncharacterized protein